MLEALLAVLARFTFAQVAVGIATVSAATVVVAGSAQVMAPPAPGETNRFAPLAVLASPVDVDPSWTVNRVQYRLSDIPTSIAAVSFMVVAPDVRPAEVVVQARHPEGARYRCTLTAAGADVAVTCPTGQPVLPVAEANRLTIEVRS